MESVILKIDEYHFEEWFNNRLTVGANPESLKFIQPFETIISVSDRIPSFFNEFQGNYYWLPMPEIAKGEAMSLTSTFGAMLAIYQSYKNNSRCFVHCEMGINRSKFVESCFYYLVLGRHLESEDARIIGGRGFINALFKNTAKSIPLPLKKMECFLDILAEKCFHDDVSQNLLDDILLELSRRYP